MLTILKTFSIWSKLSEGVKVILSCPTLRPHGLYSPWNSLGHHTGVGSLSLLQGIFPTNRSNPGLPHYRWILYQLSHKGSPRILEWVAYHFSNRSSWPRNWTGVSYITGRFFTSWALRDALEVNWKGEKAQQVGASWTVKREVGGGIKMGNTCKSMADSCQCMTKTTTIL